MSSQTAVYIKQQKTPGAIVHPAFLLDETELP